MRKSQSSLTKNIIPHETLISGKTDFLALNAAEITYEDLYKPVSTDVRNEKKILCLVLTYEITLEISVKIYSTNVIENMNRSR